MLSNVSPNRPPPLIPNNSIMTDSDSSISMTGSSRYSSRINNDDSNENNIMSLISNDSIYRDIHIEGSSMDKTMELFPFRCNGCYQSFATKHMLKEHKKVKHGLYQRRIPIISEMKWNKANDKESGRKRKFDETKSIKIEEPPSKKQKLNVDPMGFFLNNIDDRLNSLEYSSSNAIKYMFRSPSISIKCEDIEIDKNMNEEYDDDEETEDEEINLINLNNKKWIKLFISHRIKTYDLDLDSKEIIFDLKGINDYKKLKMIEDLMGYLNDNGVFKKCESLKIKAHSMEIQKEISRLIGILENIDKLCLYGMNMINCIDIICMIKSDKLKLHLLSMTDIEINDVKVKFVDIDKIAKFMHIMLKSTNLSMRDWYNSMGNGWCKNRWNKRLLKEIENINNYQNNVCIQGADYRTYGDIEIDVFGFRIFSNIIKYRAGKIRKLSLEFGTNDMFKLTMPQRIKCQKLKVFRMILAKDKVLKKEKMEIDLLRKIIQYGLELKTVEITIPNERKLRKTEIKQIKKCKKKANKHRIDMRLFKM